MAQAALPAVPSRNQGQYLPQSSEQKSNAAKARWAKQGKSAKAQALELQTALHKAGIAMSSDLEDCKDDKAARARAGSVLSGIAKGWQSMQEVLRVMSGKPLPGSLRPSDKPKGKAKQAHVNPVQPSPDSASASVLPLPVPVPVQTKESLS